MTSTRKFRGTGAWLPCSRWRPWLFPFGGHLLMQTWCKSIVGAGAWRNITVCARHWNRSFEKGSIGISCFSSLPRITTNFCYYSGHCNSPWPTARPAWAPCWYRPSIPSSCEVENGCSQCPTRSSNCLSCQIWSAIPKISNNLEYRYNQNDHNNCNNCNKPLFHHDVQASFKHVCVIVVPS